MITRKKSNYGYDEFNIVFRLMWSTYSHDQL